MISIVIPLYNKKDCIRKTMDSVLAQNFKDFEVIVVDDGSIDDSAKVVSSIPDDRIRLITKVNGGPSSARNRGIEEAQGDIISFIDADDVWAPDHLESLTQLISDFPDAVIYGMNYGLVQDGALVQPNTDSYRGYLNGDWNCFPFFFWTSSTCCRKSVLNKVGRFDERMMYGEDCDLWFRLLLEGRGAIDTKVSAFYNKDADDSLTRHSMPLEKHIPFFLDKYAEVRKGNACFRRFFDEQMVYRLYPYLFDSHYRKVARSLAAELDYSQLKKSMQFRMNHPYAYRLLRSLKQSIKKR